MTDKERKHEYISTLGMHIRQLRIDKEKTIEEIAYKANLDAQNLRKYELGKQEMRVTTLKRIADALEMSVSQLMDF